MNTIRNEYTALPLMLTVGLSGFGLVMKTAVDAAGIEEHKIERLSLTEKLRLIESGARGIYCKVDLPRQTRELVNSVPPDHDALTAVLKAGQCNPGTFAPWKPSDSCKPFCPGDQADIDAAYMRRYTRSIAPNPK